MSRFYVGLSLLVICLGNTGAGWADTVGLWLFDRLEDTTLGDPPDIPNPPGGERLFDETANQLHLTTQTNFGTRTLSTDRPAVMPAGTYSLDLVDGGASQILSPSSDLFHRGKTGELTIEFWYKPPRLEDAIYNVDYDYVIAFDGNSTQSYLADWGVYKGGEDPDGSYALHFFDYSAGSGYPEFNTGKIFVPGGPWQHIAIVIDTAGNGTLYIDGQSVATQSFGVAVPPVASILRLGAQADTGSRSGTFFIDELRISDVALPSGNGSGLGELAWNTSLQLVPSCGDFAYPYPTGDLTEDCYVDQDDIHVLTQAWLDTSCQGADWCDGADLDQDGTVNLHDFSVVAVHWGDCTDPGAPCNYEPSGPYGNRDELPSVYNEPPYDTLPVFNVRTDGNATGDGLHDDTQAIQSMINLAASQPLQPASKRRAIVYIPAGSYYVTPQEDMWETAYDNNGTPSDMSDDSPTHTKCLTVPGGVIVTGPKDSLPRPTISNDQGDTQGDPQYPAQADPIGVHIFATGVWNTEPSQPYDYRPDWREFGENLEFTNLKVVGYPLAQVYIDANAQGRQAENSAFQVMHGYRVSFNNVHVESFHRGFATIRSTGISFDNCQAVNCWYISLAFYAPNWHGRAGVVTNDERIFVRNCDIYNTDAFVASFLSRASELSFNPTYIQMLFFGMYISGWTTVENCYFERCGIAAELTVYTRIANCEFRDSKFGIHYGYLSTVYSSQWYSWPYPASEITANMFNNVTTPIIVGNNTGVDIVDNIITQPNSGIGTSYYNGYAGDLVYGGYYGFYGWGKAGIWMEDVKDILVSGNQIHDLQEGHHSAGVVVKYNPRMNSQPDVYTAIRRPENVHIENNEIFFTGGDATQCLGFYAENVDNLSASLNTARMGDASGAYLYNRRINCTVSEYLDANPLVTSPRRITIMHPFHPNAWNPNTTAWRDPTDEVFGSGL